MSTTRRAFLGAAAAGFAAAAQEPKRAANDRIQFATIGVGTMGSDDTRIALLNPGVELAGVCDIYDGRLTHAKEVFGDHIFTTRDYREILARKDVDAVIIATPDHWHSRISIDALRAGKDVYCQKPMVQRIEQGKAVVEVAQKSGKIFQVGSQYVSAGPYLKAAELIRGGAIGEVNMVEAWLDRNSAIGAWQYTIPPDAAESNIDWDRFLGSAPKRPFEPIRLFRWRNYQDYGTGSAGDLFVHLLSGLHVAVGSIDPTRVFASGGLRYWKDGRDVPDVMTATMDYPATKEHPAFNLVLRVNLKCGVNGEQLGFRFNGSEGALMLGTNVTVAKAPPQSRPGYTIDTFSKAVQKQFLEEYNKKYPPAAGGVRGRRNDETVYEFKNDSPQRAHHKVFFDAVRNRKPVVEDAVFGLRAAGPALLTNLSLFEQRICGWDPREMKVRKA